jgi:protein CpxP
MKTMKALSLLPGVIALMLAASPVIPAFTNPAFADNSPAAGRVKIWDQLNLTDAQKAQIKQIHEATKQKIDAILTPDQKAQMQTARQQHQKPKLNLTDAQKAQIKTIRQAAQSQIKAILTPDQQQKLDTLRQQWRQQHPKQQSN